LQYNNPGYEASSAREAEIGDRLLSSPLGESSCFGLSFHLLDDGRILQQQLTSFLTLQLLRDADTTRMPAKPLGDLEASSAARERGRRALSHFMDARFGLCTRYVQLN